VDLCDGNESAGKNKIKKKNKNKNKHKNKNNKKQEPEQKQEQGHLFLESGSPALREKWQSKVHLFLSSVPGLKSLKPYMRGCQNVCSKLNLCFNFNICLLRIVVAGCAKEPGLIVPKKLRLNSPLVSLQTVVPY